ncbi:hypothetical protein TcasGA2_TC034273 [Tribolium castaneum]|uniref:Uncharacterized protein n=1 Tax=Tribolium castaneum TaxID=7070 RepID=A0A139WBZ6_TRICA|nr:hypothetical protein TcasGA2_TC034273 [Tribolium castaneum]
MVVTGTDGLTSPPKDELVAMIWHYIIRSPIQGMTGVRAA